MLRAVPDAVPGREIGAHLDLLRGATVRAGHIGADMVARPRKFVGGGAREYAARLTGARTQAVDGMTDEARKTGAEAVVGMRMQTSAISRGTSAVMACGRPVEFR